MRRKIIFGFLLVGLLGTTAYAASDDVITSLPGYGAPKQIEYAGYASTTLQPCATIHCTEKPGLFYWFVSAQTPNALKKPIIVWSNGGPGSSSIYGLLLENGPYKVTPDLKLSDNPNSWTHFANYLVIDHPLSVGLSFSTPENYPHTVLQGTTQYYYALKHFFELHPEYQNNPVFLAGESYAGTYLPLLANKILQENALHPQQKIHLAGMIVASGWVDPLVQQSMDSTFAYYHGLITESQKQEVDHLYQQCATAIRAKTPTTAEADRLCNQVSGTIVKFSGIYEENIELDHGPTDINMIKYLNLPNVRTALHAQPKGTYADWSHYVDQEYHVGEQESYRFLYDHLLSEHIPILFFTGLADEKDSNFLGARAWMQLLVWPGKKAYDAAPTKQWRDPLNHDLLGYTKKGGGFEWVTVLNAGHLISIDQPKTGLIVQEFVEQNTKK